MASTYDNTTETEIGENKISTSKPASTYLWHGFTGDLNITTFNLFTKLNVTDVSLGYKHNLFLIDDGSVYINGENDMGQLGLGMLDVRVVEEPIKVEGLPDRCVHIACGAHHSAVITDTGQIFCWGSSRDGQCGTGSLDVVDLPARVPVEINEGFCAHGVPKPPIPVAVKTASCGTSHTLAISYEGDVWAWGAGPQLGLGELKHAPLPRRVDTLEGLVTMAVCCGDKHSMVLVARGEKSPSRAGTPRSSPMKTKGKTEAKDVQEDKLYPSRCSTCQKEIYTYTDTNDMCIIDTLHDCTINDGMTSVDSTIVDDVSLSSSSNEALKNSSSVSPPREEENPNGIDTTGEGCNQTISEQPSELKETSEGETSDSNLQPEQQPENSNLDPNTSTGGLVGETSFLETSAFDTSVLVVSGDNPFDDSVNLTAIEEVEEPQGIPFEEGDRDVQSPPPVPSSSTVNEEASDETVNVRAVGHGGSDDEVWKRRSDSEEVEEELNKLYAKPKTRSPSTVSVKSLNLLNQSEASMYLQRQFEEEATEAGSAPSTSDGVPKREKSQTSLGNMFDMMAQVKSMTSRAFTNIQSLSGFTTLPADQPNQETIPQNARANMEMGSVATHGAADTEIKPSQSDSVVKPGVQSAGQSNASKESPEHGENESFQKSGTFIEWTREMASMDEDPASLAGDSSHKSIRTIQMQQKNLNRISSVAEPQTSAHDKVATNTDVWVWGCNEQGQLGLGDQLERAAPVNLKFFMGRHVVKLAAGGSHSIALTSNCQVFSWGLNSYGQLGQMEAVHGPTRLRFLKGFTAWDIGGGSAHSVFLCDGPDAPNSQPKIFYCGKHPSKEQHASMKKTNILVPLPQVNQNGWVTKVMAGGIGCACKTLNPAPPETAAVFELAATERSFYNQLIRTTNLLLRPLQKSTFYTSMDVYPYKSSLQNLISTFLALTKKVGEGITDLTSTIQQSTPLNQSLFLAGYPEFLEAFRNYSRRFSDFLAVGGFDYVTRAGSEFFEKIQGSIRDLSDERDKSVGASSLFLRAMRYPFFRLVEYSRILGKIATALEKQEMKNSFQNVILEWDGIKVSFSAEHKVAESTRAFWEVTNPKVADTMRTPDRRVLRESKTYPLHWPAGGRFSNRLFVLFNDVFLHLQSTGLTVLPLETLWVEPGTTETENPNAITIIAPEERYDLQATTPAQKAEWLIALNSAISKHLSPQRSPYSAGERFTPPLVRHAKHKFIRPGLYREASYDGTWFSGKIHGRGTLKWSDGSVYEGNFMRGLMHGSGVLSNVKSSGKEIQKGNWKDGKLNGRGTISYANGDVYEGYFQDGQRFGHGMLQTGGQKSRCASVYIGEWLCNVKEGYGVQDDILKGEKYMGMWAEDNRHGNGVMVTLDGMYFEGTFVQNKLTGFGVMISDDNTLYEGDFVGTSYLSGKGTLTLPSGDRLEGNFTGSLNDGLKINGTFTKSSTASDNDGCTQHAGGIKSRYFGRLCVAADGKWDDIFSHVWAVLGQGQAIQGHSPTVDTEKAWEVVAVMVNAGRKALKEQTGISPSKIKVQQNTLEGLAKIPKHGRESLTLETVSEISTYLSRAFDTVHHPLGQLMETLVDVFRASYIGVGAHPRLLHHAVQEVKSYIRRKYKVVRVLFPALPANGGPVHVYPHKSDIPRTTEEAKVFIEGLETEDPNISVLTAAGLLYPILLPKIYPPLFDLYALYNESHDDRYWERVTKLNRQSDMGLMAYLGIEQRFWLMEEILEHDKTQKLSTIKDVCYAEAVDVLQQLSTAFSPLEKLKIIEQTFNEITKTVTQALKDEHMWCMDDLFPIFQFVVVRAKIHHLGAELQMIEDLMEPHMEHGEFGLMFTTLKACYFQVQNEKMPRQ